jgi:hypothetical protein
MSLQQVFAVTSGSLVFFGVFIRNFYIKHSRVWY